MSDEGPKCHGLVVGTDRALIECHIGAYNATKISLLVIGGVMLGLACLNFFLLVRKFGWTFLNSNIRTRLHWVLAAHVIVGVWVSIDVYPSFLACVLTYVYPNFLCMCLHLCIYTLTSSNLCTYIYPSFLACVYICVP